MPRPGPRPYECVRRAWHSDRHEALRGSIIQQIFRVAHETHSDTTKKNKEWLRKLPTVVFKAEEIIYSKANSEAEYMNLETLPDRVNDAIDTIIRRDETAESGQLLPPCIEAALNLGCVPVRASRSERHNTPRIYLTPRPEISASDTCTRSGKPPNEHHPPLMSIHAENHQPKAIRPENMTSTPIASVSSKHPPFYESISRVPNNPTDLGSVYPLYYGTDCAARESWALPERPILVGTPVRNFLRETSKFSAFINPNFSHNTEIDLDQECDLSLRLGIKRSSVPETEDVGASNTELWPKLSKEICFFPENGARKRKALFGSDEEDARFSLQPYRVRRPGS